MFVRLGVLSLAAVTLWSISVSSDARNPMASCTMVGSEKLGQTVSAAAICDAVKKAVADAARGVPYSVEIRALSPSRLTAKLIVNDRILPIQNFAVMDRNLSERAVQNFASSLASVVKDSK